MKKNSKSQKIQGISLAIDVVMLIYFAMYLVWVFLIPIVSGYGFFDDILHGVFTHINPMTWGAYFIGVAVIIHFYAYRNTLSRILITVPYIVSVVLSLVAIMGMTSASELLMFAPHIAIIVVIIVVVKMRGKLTKEK